MQGQDAAQVTPLGGIRYYHPPEDAVLLFKDDKERIPYGGLPLPLLEDDFLAMEGEPSYDVVGRGIYQALRMNPDCAFGDRYAALLRDAYPHYVAELASQVIMIDSKDVDVPYLDRKINSLRILLLLEPENPGLLREIGMAFLDRGMRMSALHLSTVSIYKAESFFRRALSLAPEDPAVLRLLGEACYLLGKYDDAVGFLRNTVAGLDADGGEKLRRRLEQIEAGTLPHIPPVDYLEALGAAISLFHMGNYDEAVAIIQDVLMDPVFREEFPIPEIHCVKGKSFAALDMPKYAEESFRDALQIDPECEEALEGLRKLSE